MKYSSWSVVQIKDQKGKPYQAVLKYKDNNDKWKNKRKTLGVMGKREAQRQAEDWFYEMNQLAEDSAVKEEETVEGVISRFLLSQQSQHKIEDSTFYRQNGMAKNYIYPYIGSLGFYSLDRLDLEKWIGELFSKGYSKKTIESVFAVLAKVYKHYYQLEQIEKNPCEFVKVPKGKPKKSYMTDEQMNNFLVAVWLEFDEDDPMLIGCLLLYYCALRISEAIGLRYSDIDFDRKLLTVNSAVGYSENGEYMKDPKSKSSQRTFPIPPQVLPILQKNKGKPSDFVCGISMASFRWRFKQFVEAYNLEDAYGKHLTPHLLRHSFGFSSVRAGADIGALSKIMGHSSQAITLNVYSDTSPDAVRAGMDKITNFFKERDLDE